MSDDDTKNKETKSKKSKKKKYLVLLFVLILFVTGAFYFLHNLNKPVVGVVSSTQSSSLSTVSYDIDLTPVSESGKYISFDYPKGMRLLSSALADPATSLESYNYYAKDLYSWTLAIDLTKTGSGQVNATSAYTSRATNPQMYSEGSMNVNNQAITVFTDKSFTGGFSKVAFFSHGDIVATVSLIGDDSSGVGPLETTFNMVLSSWEWKV
ncbi:MAG TPA: hypothetical protein VMR34_01205 [Candidatus Saccharimonadales bacterium]|nr:hypothetical protein [Candidatus Saccharimonadales bacterium]